jgi:uncharacterized coiled-coil protein SlyX
MFPRHAVDEWGTITETRRQDLEKTPSALDNLFRRFGKWQKSIRDYHSGILNFSRSAFPVTLLFAREHDDYVATDDDTHTARLLVFNLAAAWEALPEMQEEFRKQFGHLYPASELDRLETYERSNFQNLWPAAFGMHTDRQTRIPNFTVVKERALEQLCEAFLQILGQELNETLGEESTSIVTTNFILNDTPHLGIICRFELLRDLEEGLERIMQAVGRACRFKEWSFMEWQPLVGKWPKIAVFRLLNGRILAPECVLLDTMVLCAKETLKPGESPVIPPAIEVGESKLLAFGIAQWKHPLLDRVFTLRTTLLAAGLTAGRLFEIMAILESYEITEEKQNRVLDRYNQTLTTAMAEAVREYLQLRYLLEALPHHEAPGWINRLDAIAANLTFSSRDDNGVALTVDDFVKLDDCFGENSAKLNALASEIVAGLLQSH